MKNKKKIGSTALALLLAMNMVGCKKTDYDAITETRVNIDFSDELDETKEITTENTTTSTLQTTETTTKVTTEETTTTIETTTTSAPTTTTEETTTMTSETTLETTVYNDFDNYDYSDEIIYYGNKIVGMSDAVDDYLNEKIENFDYERSKEQLINKSKNLIDFIFYGAEMNGTTFNELADDAKQDIYATLQETDEFIMKYYPNYKEDLGEKYNVIKNFASVKLNDAKEAFNSHIDIDITINKNKSLKRAR